MPAFRGVYRTRAHPSDVPAAAGDASVVTGAARGVS